MTRRARAFAMLGLSALFAGLAVSLVQGYESDVRKRVGPLVSVLIASRNIPRGKLLTPANTKTYVAEARVPARFAPPQSFRAAREVVGLQALIGIPEGSYVGEAELGPAKERAGPALRPDSDGERLVEVTVAGASALGDTLQPGARVDVLITSERGAGLPGTYVALQRVELVGFRAGSESLGNGGSRSADGVAALRVTLRQAVLLTAAQNFARELRLVARPPGDESRIADTAVTAEQLRP